MCTVWVYRDHIREPNVSNFSLFGHVEHDSIPPYQTQTDSEFVNSMNVTYCLTYMDG